MAARSVDDVLALYARWGSDGYDEDVSQLVHALQTGALAREARAPDALVAAALLHDIGHLLHLERTGGQRDRGGVDLRHESVGARHLSDLFPPAVTRPIALHVSAKRYRCAVEPDYLLGLSTGSTDSLRSQGGPMSSTEVAAFERTPGHDDAVRLRGWDDTAKVVGLDVAPLEHYVELLRTVAA